MTEHEAKLFFNKALAEGKLQWPQPMTERAAPTSGLMIDTLVPYDRPRYTAMVRNFGYKAANAFALERHVAYRYYNPRHVPARRYDVFIGKHIVAVQDFSTFIDKATVIRRHAE